MTPRLNNIPEYHAMNLEGEERLPAASGAKRSVPPLNIAACHPSRTRELTDKPWFCGSDDHTMRNSSASGSMSALVAEAPSIDMLKSLIDIPTMFAAVRLWVKNAKTQGNFERAWHSIGSAHRQAFLDFLIPQSLQGIVCLG